MKTITSQNISLFLTYFRRKVQFSFVEMNISLQLAVPKSLLRMSLVNRDRGLFKAAEISRQNSIETDRRTINRSGRAGGSEKVVKTKTR